MSRMLDGIGRLIARHLDDRSSATSRSRQANRTRCVVRFSPATYCWSKATTTFPASSNI